MTRERWPGWVYDGGDEPDYRFSFANERTFLAWIRTSLALLAGGVALDVVDLSMSDDAQRGLAAVMVGLGMLSAVAAWVRWARAERAMRRREALPSFGYGALFTACLVIAALVLIAVGI
ncbi:YidH family protein [Nocardioides pacificus]